MDVGAVIPARSEPFELVISGQGPLHDPAVAAEPRAVQHSTPGDDRADPALPELLPVAIEVIAPVGEQDLWAVAWTAPPAPHGRDRIHQRQQLGDVVGVSAGQADREGNPAGVADEVVLAAGACAVDRACARLVPPFNARTGEASITARDQSSRSTARNRARRSWWSLSQTPAWFQSRSRRQQVIPEP
jgi:hypothetical protein